MKIGRSLSILSISIIMCIVASACSFNNTSRNPEITTENTENSPDKNKQNIVIVHNAKELLDSLMSGIIIRLEPGDYDLNKIINIDDDCKSSFIKDGHIFDLNNVTFEGVGEKPIDFITVDTVFPVLMFENCENINLKNLNLGHKPKIDYRNCQGSVVEFLNCESIKIEGCILFGCGLKGLNLKNVQDMEFNNSIIKECSRDIVCIYNCSNIIFKASQFFDNNGGVNTGNSDKVKFVNCELSGKDFLPVFSDENQYVYLSDEGTIEEELSDYSAACVQHFVDNISNVEFENVWLSDKNFLMIGKQIYNCLSSSLGKNLKLIGLIDSKDDSSRRGLFFDLDVALEKEYSMFSVDDIELIVGKLKVAKALLYESGIESLRVNVYKNEFDLVSVEMKLKDFDAFLARKTDKGLEDYSKITLLAFEINIATFFKKTENYLNRQEAVDKVDMLIDIKKDVSDKAYSEGEDFQFFTYNGASCEEGRLFHNINLVQELPLLGDYLHYAFFAEFKVDALTGKVYETNDITGENEAKRVPEEIKQFILDSSRIKFEFENGKDVIGTIDERKIYSITGNCDTFAKIDVLLSKYFERNAYKAELDRRCLFLIDDRIGYIDRWNSRGDMNIDENNSLFLLLNDEPDRKVVKVQLFSEIGGQYCSIYTITKSGDNWIIADEKLIILPNK